MVDGCVGGARPRELPRQRTGHLRWAAGIKLLGGGITCISLHRLSFVIPLSMNILKFYDLAITYSICVSRD